MTSPKIMKYWRKNIKNKYLILFVCAEKQRIEILNGLQKSRNKFSPSSKNKPDKMNIYLGSKCNFVNRVFFPNSNKIAIKLQNKII